MKQVRIKPFLLLQSRPEDETSDSELAAILQYGGLRADQVQRVRMEKTSLPSVNLVDYSAVIVGGGPYNYSDSQATKPSEQVRFEAELADLLTEIIATDKPYLGACSGLGALAKKLGGVVSKDRYSEGVEALTINLSSTGQADELLMGLPASFRAFAGHKESCQDIPPGATLLASSANCPVHMVRVKQNIYATQFHPELDKVGLALRINFYKHKGYFPPEDADKLIAAGNAETITVPGQILRRFVERYSVLESV